MGRTSSDSTEAVAVQGAETETTTAANRDARVDVA